MRYMIMALLLAAGMMTLPVSSTAADQSAKVIVKQESSFFRSIWIKLRRMVPSNSQQQKQVTAVMGVRGKETTESALNPYWAGDVGENPEFKKELASYNRAKGMCESGSEAGKGAERLKTLYKDSEYDFMQPNYMLALAGCYQQAGKLDTAYEYLEKFVKKYPDHPLAAEATTELSKG